MKYYFTFFILFLLNSFFSLFCQVNLIPEPREIEVLEGYFTLSSSTQINFKNDQTENTTALFNRFLDENFGIHLKKGAARKNGITLILDGGSYDESYSLRVTSEGISITGDAAGIFYGMQTLKQLIFEENETILIPCVIINDSPRFTHRGLMLDVGRYFYSKEYIKEFIDLMAQFKLNVFHWHLTEDNGWRIEIKR